MRAILIDPTERSIGEVELPDFIAEIRRKFGGARLTRIATLPTGVIASTSWSPTTTTRTRFHLADRGRIAASV
jgi:hypothetical protein